ncbi:hypothetical protein MAFF241647_41610 (plasmid) [Ralstonia solanacearum]|nr:transposase [Ralstonia solanacearum]BCM09804.1 hypothetical protein MAFF241647_41610 [Ralstonia solanacearum]
MACLLAQPPPKRSQRVKGIIGACSGNLFADGAYDRTALMDKATTLDFVVEVVRRHEQQTGFAVLPRRWVVERTFGWSVRWRRLVRDYEQRADVLDVMIHIAMSGLLLRRIAHP